MGMPQKDNALKLNAPHQAIAEAAKMDTQEEDPFSLDLDYKDS